MDMARRSALAQCTQDFAQCTQDFAQYLSCKRRHDGSVRECAAGSGGAYGAHQCHGPVSSVQGTVRPGADWVGRGRRREGRYPCSRSEEDLRVTKRGRNPAQRTAGLAEGQQREFPPDLGRSSTQSVRLDERRAFVPMDGEPSMREQESECDGRNESETRPSTGLKVWCGFLRLMSRFPI